MQTALIICDASNDLDTSRDKSQPGFGDVASRKRPRTSLTGNLNDTK